MTFLALLLGVSVQAVEPVEGPIGDPALRVREHVEEFEVPGRTYRRFYDNIDEYGPQGLFSYFEYAINFSARWESDGKLCGRVSPEVELRFTYHLPRWTNYQSRNEREQAAFDEVYASQRVFLEGYARLVRRGGVGLIDDLRELESQDCAALGETLNGIAQAWYDAISDAVETYEDGAGEVPLRDTVCLRTGSRIRRCGN